MPEATANIGTPETVPLIKLNHYAKNPRRGDVQAIKGSIVANGIFRPVIVNKGTYTEKPNEILAGNHTVKAIRELAEENPDDTRWQQVEVWMVDVDAERAARIVLADNRTADLGSYDSEELLSLLNMMDGDLDGTGYDADDLAELTQLADGGEDLAGDDNEDYSLDEVAEAAAITLAERFLVPPVTVIDTRRGEWRERKRAWLKLGVAAQEGRDGQLIYASPTDNFINWYEIKNKALAENNELTNKEILEKYEDKLKPYNEGGGTSVFDPVLCEILYLWFSNPGDRTLDPWAGGSVRGIVGAMLHRHYQGHELRAEQCVENRKQADRIKERGHLPHGVDKPVWIDGDSAKTMQDNQAESFDFIIGCPPYYDLEQYSDDEADISNLSTEDFNAAMAVTLQEVDRCLRPNRFAAFVVGSARDKRGDLRDMKACMMNAMPDGWHLANDAVLVNNVGTGAIRAKKMFEGGRSLARVHQDILVFVKGDRKTAAKRLDAIKVAELDSMDNEN